MLELMIMSPDLFMDRNILQAISKNWYAVNLNLP